jgi:hypothetical protein
MGEKLKRTRESEHGRTALYFALLRSRGSPVATFKPNISTALPTKITFDSNLNESNLPTDNQKSFTILRLVNTHWMSHPRLPGNFSLFLQFLPSQLIVCCPQFSSPLNFCSQKCCQLRQAKFHSKLQHPNPNPCRPAIKVDPITSQQFPPQVSGLGSEQRQ